MREDGAAFPHREVSVFGRFKRNRAAQPRPVSTAGVPRWPLEAWRRQDLDPDSPEYAAVCLTPAFPEHDEPRMLDDATLRRIVAVRSAAEMDRLAGELSADERYAGLDTVYGWLVRAYVGTDRELEVIEEGLRGCPRKYGVLDLAGTAMLRRGRAADALYYWAQSVTNAESVGEADDATAYDFLIVAARAMAEPAAVLAFGVRAETQYIALDDEHTDLVSRLFRRPTEPMRVVVRGLAERVLG